MLLGGDNNNWRREGCLLGFAGSLFAAGFSAKRLHSHAKAAAAAAATAAAAAAAAAEVMAGAKELRPGGDVRL